MKTLWIFSALCKAAWLIWNALSNTGTYTGIKSHSKTDSDTENRRTRWGKAAVLAMAGAASPPLPPLPLGRQLHRPFLFAVCSVGADLHQRPSEAGPFVVVRNSQLGGKRQGIRRREGEAGHPSGPKSQPHLGAALLSQSGWLCTVKDQGLDLTHPPWAAASTAVKWRQVPRTSLAGSYSGRKELLQSAAVEKNAWFYLIYLILRQSVLPECCCKIYPLVKIFQIFQTKARPWSLQTSTCMFNFTHVWPFAASEAAPKCNCLRDWGQCVQSNRALTALYRNCFPEVH